MTAALLLATVLAVAIHARVSGRTLSSRVAALFGRASRPRMILGWAAGLWVAYGVSALFALALLGRSEAIGTMPAELQRAAHALGLAGQASGAEITAIILPLAAGALLGLAILWWRGPRGLPSFGIAYRSPAMARAAGERPAAFMLALAAGVGEELFFRLTLPLLVAIVTGSGLAGIAIGWGAFVALHRHQGPGGMIAVALVGAALTALYLATGQLWLAMLVHTAIDANTLIVRPWLTRGAD